MTQTPARTGVPVLPALATLGPALAPDGAAPAAFAGVATGVSVGVGAIVHHLRVTADDVEAQRTNSYLPAIALLVAAAVLIVLANRRLTLEDT